MLYEAAAASKLDAVVTTIYYTLLLGQMSPWTASVRGKSEADTEVHSEKGEERAWRKL